MKYKCFNYQIVHFVELARPAGENSLTCMLQLQDVKHTDIDMVIELLMIYTVISIWTHQHLNFNFLYLLVYTFNIFGNSIKTNHIHV